MSKVVFNPLSKDPAEIERMWFAPALPPVRAGWLLYSEDFVLGTLQGCPFDRERVRRTTGWRLLAGGIRGVMGLAQFVLILLSVIPVLSWLVYMVAKAFPRNAVGFFLRGCYWKPRLKRLGVDTLIDQGVEFNRPAAIEIGNRCHLDRNVLLSVGSEKGYIRLGDYVFMGPSCHVAGRGGVEIGDFAGLAARVHVYSVSNLPFHTERLGELVTMSHSAPTSRQCTMEAPVRIGPYAVIGLGTIILPGVTLGRGVIVHAYSEVTLSFPAFAIVSGHGRGAQKGWRRPGRLDPRLSGSQNPDEKSAERAGSDGGGHSLS